MELAQRLQESSFGIICVTKDNANSVWLNFEAGALSKEIENSIVCPFLFGMEREELSGPLSQFQFTVYDKADIRKLVSKINSSLEKPIDTANLDKLFEALWLNLEGDLNALLDEANSNTATRISPHEDNASNNTNELLEEILDLTRKQYELLNTPESFHIDFQMEKFFEHIMQTKKIEDNIMVTKVIRDIVNITTQLTYDSANLSEKSPDDIKHVQAKISSLATTVKYLERLVPLKSFSTSKT